MHFDPTFSVLLYSIQICFSTANGQNLEWLESGGFFLLSSEGSLFFCNLFFGGGFLTQSEIA
jgi:hypothetical protein